MRQKSPISRIKTRARSAWIQLAHWQHLDLLIVALIITSIASINWWWILSETRPPHWDMARHLWTSLHYWDLLQNHQAIPLLEDYRYYPPLVYWVALPFYKLFGTTIPAAVMSNTVFVTVLCYSVYALARRLGGRVNGLVAVLLVASYPIIVTQFKEYQLDAPLMAMVALALCLLVYSEGFLKRRYTLAFGVVCGLGMLTKWTFVACIALPTLFALAQALRADIRARAPRRLAVVGVAALIAYTICSPWYATNIQQLRIDMNANGTQQAINEGDPLPGTLAGKLWYLKSLITTQLYLPGMILFVVGLAVLMWRRIRRVEVVYLLLAIVGMYIAFTDVPNKDARYILPMLPPIAILSVSWICHIPKPRVRKLAYGAIAAYSIVMFLAISIGTSLLPKNSSFAIGSLTIPVFAQQGYIIGPPSHEAWGLPTVFDYLSCPPVNQRSLSYDGANTIWLNNWDFAYYQERFHVTPADPDHANYLLIRTTDAPDRTGALLRYHLPDHSTLSLYRRQ